MTEISFQKKITNVIPKSKIAFKPLTEDQKKKLAIRSSKNKKTQERIYFGMISGLFTVFFYIFFEALFPSLNPLAIILITSIFFLLAYYFTRRENLKYYEYSNLNTQNIDRDLSLNKSLIFTLEANKAVLLIFTQIRGSHQYFIVQLPNNQLLLFKGKWDLWVHEFNTIKSTLKTLTQTKQSFRSSITFTVGAESGTFLNLAASGKIIMPLETNWIHWFYFSKTESLISYLPNVWVFPGTLDKWESSLKEEAERMRLLIQKN